MVEASAATRGRKISGQGPVPRVTDTSDFAFERSFRRPWRCAHITRAL
jgi:hypothetical protein